SVHLADFPQVDEALLDRELEAGMAAVQRTVRLGHAARSAGKVKVRQPLRRAVIVASEDERASIEALADLVTAELNVMDLDFVSEQGELVTYTVKPNYRTLGPRFGKGMPQVAAAVSALDASSVASTLAEGGEVGVSLDGHDHTLGSDDLIMALAPLEGYEVEAEAGHAVALQLEIDEELRRAGLAREIVRAVQDARKNAGLEITDRIELGLGGDAELLAVASEHEAYIAGEVLATDITPGDEEGAGGTVSAATIDSRDLRISVRPV
ncbi:MAG: isoleucine--tRNA ligase, partial [Actinobacteria bacterium]|nr:isoleucine--tRNA ligase [Actinomycetota bacterium]